MLEKLRAVLRLGTPTGNTLGYESTKARIDRTLLEFKELQERRRFLEEHMKPWYSDAQYQGALCRIRADQRRIMTKLRRYFAMPREGRPRRFRCPVRRRAQHAGERRHPKLESLEPPKKYRRRRGSFHTDTDSAGVRKSW